MADTRHFIDAAPNGRDPRRLADRDAMRRLIGDHGFEHAIESVATAVAVAVTPALGQDYDDRLGQMSEKVEHTLLDTLASFAREQGWGR